MFRHKEIRNRILFTVAIFLVYRLGAAITIPRVDNAALMAGVGENSFLGMINLLGGGSFEQFSIFAMGVGPYITASIVIQLLSMDVIPYLTDLTKTGGAEGKKKLDQITRYFGIVLSFAQAYAMTYAYSVQYRGLLLDNKLSTFLYVATILTAGTMFLLWIGDRISMYGVGNGTSMIIFAGIVSNYPSQFTNIYQTLVGSGEGNANFNGILWFAVYIFVYLLIVLMVIFLDNAERKIPIQYTSSQVSKSRKNVNYLPLKINSASVVPVIFASAIMTAPLTILSFFKTNKVSEFLNKVLDMKTPTGLGIYVVLIIFFTFFYTHLQVDPEKTTENLSKNGSYIPGVRPGVETKEYITKVLNRITVMGAISIAFIGALPYFITIFTDLPSSFAIGGTGVILVVGIAQETVQDLMGQLTTKSYKGFKRGF